MTTEEKQLLKEIATIVEILASGHRDESLWNWAKDVSKRVKEMMKEDGK